MGLRFYYAWPLGMYYIFVEFLAFLFFSGFQVFFRDLSIIELLRQDDNWSYYT